MTASLKPKNLSLLLHILIWSLIGFLMVFFLPFTGHVILPVQFWIRQVIIFALIISLYYVNANFLVPRLLLNNQTMLFLLSGIAVCLFFMMIIYGSERLFRLPDPAEFMRGNSNFPAPPSKSPPPFNLFAALPFLFVLAISTSIKSIQKWQEDRQSRILLEQDKISTELAYLKSQINPHFFFNTLNNIYALMHTDIEASKKSLHTLSRMMRYLLYDTQNERTLLTKELAFINDFVNLMKLRLPDNVSVICDTPVFEEDYTMHPMLFLPFIENAFKHGVDLSGPSVIEIGIRVDAGVVNLCVINTFIPSSNRIISIEKGIGVNNTKRRLDLLYPGRHNLNVDYLVDNNIFKVDLTIQL